MQYKSNKGYTGLGQLGMLLLFLGAGLMLTTVLQVVIGFSIVPPGTPLSQIGTAMLEALKDPANVSASRMLQVVGTLCVLFIPAALYSWVCNGKNPFWLGFNKYLNLYQVAIGFLLIFMANLLAMPLQELSKKVIALFPALNALAKSLEAAYNEQVVLLSNLKSIPEYILALVIMAFFPAMFEEVFFRGALQNILVKWWKSPLLGIVVTAFIFSFIHLSVYLFVSRAILGFVLGLIYFKTKNIWINIIAHFLNNAIAVSQMFLLSAKKTKLEVSELDPKVDWWVGLLAIGVLIVFFKLLDKHSENNKMKIYTREQALLVHESGGNPLTSH